MKRRRAPREPVHGEIGPSGQSSPNAELPSPAVRRDWPLDAARTRWRGFFVSASRSAFRLTARTAECATGAA